MSMNTFDGVPVALHYWEDAAYKDEEFGGDPVVKQTIQNAIDDWAWKHPGVTVHVTVLPTKVVVGDEEQTPEVEAAEQQTKALLRSLKAQIMADLADMRAQQEADLATLPPHVRDVMRSLLGL